MTIAPVVTTAEPMLSCNRARLLLGQLKGLKKIDSVTLTHLVQKEGLPHAYDPFGSGHWVFYESSIVAWFQGRMAEDQPKPLRGPGRPRQLAS